MDKTGEDNIRPTLILCPIHDSQSEFKVENDSTHIHSQKKNILMDLLNMINCLELISIAQIRKQCITHLRKLRLRT